MSSKDQNALNLLLPAASIAVFSRDEVTLNSARALSEDWRFARVKVAVKEGDVAAAISVYAQQASPSLLIIQTDIIDDNFTAQLDDLASHCTEGTSAIVIGPDNDVNLYRRLIDMGVSDYLVRPVEAAAFSQIAAKALVEKLGVSDSRLVVCLGAKGGVGTSMVASAIASLAADRLQTKTFLMDFAGGRSTLSLSFGFDPSATLSQVLRASENNDEDGLKRMIEAVSEHLSVLSTGHEAALERAAQVPQTENFMTGLLGRYPLVVVDLSQAPDAVQKALLARAQNIVLVSQASVPALRVGRTLLQEIKALRGGKAENIDLVINMQGLQAAQEIALKDVSEVFEIAPSASLPFDPKIFAANENKGERLTQDKAALAVLDKNLKPLVQKMLQEFEEIVAVKDSKGGGIGSLIGKIKGG